MSDQRYERIKSIYYEAAALEPAQRDAYIRKACNGDSAIRDELIRLVAADDSAGAFMEQPAISSGALREVASQSLVDAAPTPLPESLGRYRILKLLGEGGMGCVYEAEQDSPRRRVALKVLRAGAMLPRMLQRFQREVEVLGRLQHPGIARIYDAGVAEIAHVDGRTVRVPFFAMELIEGSTITAYAENAGLLLRDRLLLLVEVCDAVHYGHQHGVVHRDLKPANVLVGHSSVEAANRAADGASLRLPPVPKVIDFGVARVTNSDVAMTILSTEAGQLIGTIAYMSPEQVRGDPRAIDARSDIYALGVMGYEMLTGRLPYEIADKAVPEAARIIRDEEPSRMSSISRIYRGDIETIFAKALEKDPARRYDSAAALAADVRRFLDDKPIVARPPTLRYQLSKFARRHKEAVAALLLVFVVLIAGITGTTAGWLNAREAARQADQRKIDAERAAQRADQIRGIITAMLSSVQPGAQGGGRDVRVAEILDQTAAALSQSLEGQPDVELEIRTLLAETYRSLGLLKEAGENQTRALELADLIYAPDDVKRLEVIGRLAGMLSTTGHGEQAEPLLTEALALSQARYGPDARSTLSLQSSMLHCVVCQDRWEDAVMVGRAHIERLRALPESKWRDIQLSFALYQTAYASERIHHTFEAEAFMREAIALRRLHIPKQSSPLDGAMGRLLSFLILCHGRVNESADVLLEMLNWEREVLGPEHRESTLTRLDAVYRLCGAHRWSEALPLAVEDAAHELKAAGRGSRDYFRSAARVAEIHAETGAFEEAARQYQAALDLGRQSFGDTDSEVLAVWREAQFKLGVVPWLLKAPSTIRQALEGLRERLDSVNPVRFTGDEIDWARARFSLVRWNPMTRDDGSFSPGDVLASGDLADLANLGEPSPGLHLITVLFERLDGDEDVWSRWLPLLDWRMDTHVFRTADVTASLNSMKEPPSESVRTSLLGWRSDGHERCVGPDGAQAFFGVSAVGRMVLPAGAYRLTAEFDDAAIIELDGRTLMNDWNCAPVRQHTTDFSMNGAPASMSIRYGQWRGGACFNLTIEPVDRREPSLSAVGIRAAKDDAAASDS